MQGPNKIVSRYSRNKHHRFVVFSHFFDRPQRLVVVGQHGAGDRGQSSTSGTDRFRIVLGLERLQTRPDVGVILAPFRLLLERRREVRVVRFARSPRHVGAEDGSVQVGVGEWCKQCFG